MTMLLFHDLFLHANRLQPSNPSVVHDRSAVQKADGTSGGPMGAHSFVDLSRNSTWPFCCTARLGVNGGSLYRPDPYTTLHATQANQRERLSLSHDGAVAVRGGDRAAPIAAVDAQGPP